MHWFSSNKNRFYTEKEEIEKKICFLNSFFWILASSNCIVTEQAENCHMNLIGNDLPSD